MKFPHVTRRAFLGSLALGSAALALAACALGAAEVVHTARRILDDTIMPSAGGSSYFESSPLQRMQRDLEVLKGHAMFDWDRVAQLAGRVALDLPLAKTDLI